MDFETFGIDINADRLSFEEFCAKVDFFIPDCLKSHLNNFFSDIPFIIDENLLDFLGYEGDFRTKNRHFRDLLNDTKQEVGEHRITIPHNMVKIQLSNFIEISFANFIKAIMKMKTRKAMEIRIVLGDFIIVQQKYLHYLLHKSEVDKAKMINELEKDNEIVEMRYKMIIMQKEHEMELLRRDNEKVKEIAQKDKEIALKDKNHEIVSIQKDKKIAILQKDLEIKQKNSEISYKNYKINSLEENIGNLKNNMKQIFSNTVMLPVKKRQRFCIIDDSDNMEGIALKRQCRSFDKVKRDYLLSHENGVVLLELLYSTDATLFFNNIKEYVKRELSDKISIVNNTIKVISPEYNLNMFLQDLVKEFNDEIKNHECIIAKR